MKAFFWPDTGATETPSNTTPATAATTYPGNLTVILDFAPESAVATVEEAARRLAPPILHPAAEVVEKN